jgi:hypothetical protein
MQRALAACAAILAGLAAAPVAAYDAREPISPLAMAAVGDGAPPASAPAAVPRAEPVTLVLKADLTAQQLTVLENGKVLHLWPISSGRRGHATPVGTFRPTWMARSWYSRQYDNAPMPHAVFFTRGVALHGTQHLRMLGRPASHGCIRLAPTNAALLYGLVRRHGLGHTKVVVYGTPLHREPAAVASRRSDKRTLASARDARGSVRTSRHEPTSTASWQWFFAQ